MNIKSPIFGRTDMSGAGEGRSSNCYRYLTGYLDLLSLY